MTVDDIRPGDELEHMNVPRFTVASVSRGRNVLAVTGTDGSMVWLDEPTFEMWWDAWRDGALVHLHTHCRESIRRGILKRRDGPLPLSGRA